MDALIAGQGLVGESAAKIAEAPGFHMPVTQFAPRSIGAQDFEAVTEATLHRVFRKRLRQMTLSV